MKYSICLLLLLIVTNINLAQGLKTPQTESEDAIKFLIDIEEKDRDYIKFLSTYAIPPEKRSDAVLFTSFLLHSLVGPTLSLDENNAGSYYPLASKLDNGNTMEYRRVPGSDTLWWIDLRDYNWTPSSWENAANIDGYFVEPIVQHPTAGALRLLAGNAVLRMDWFINHVSDSTKQLDTDRSPTLYNNFLFASVKTPTNIDEYRKYFSIDIDKSRQLGNEFATLVTKSKIVAKHNRLLFGYRTELGYWYDTYDVKNQEGSRDFLEAFFKNEPIATPPKIFDAGEAFGSNMLGLQVYALYDGQGKLINFGDPTVVRHIGDVVGDVRVRIAHSCFDCHAGGPLPSENTLKEFITAGGNQYFKNKIELNRTNRVLLSSRFEDSIKQNQDYFVNALKKCNGLTPDENGKIYLDLVRSYNEPVTVSRAALECGVTEQEFITKVIKGNYGARLKLLAINKEPIPIDIWETRGKDGIPGQFQQAMIQLNGLTKITNEEVINPEESTYLTKIQTNLMVGPRVLSIIPANTKVKFLEKNGEWLYIEYQNKQGFVKISDLEFIK